MNRWEQYKAIGTVDECREARETAKIGEWISVEERLPKKDGFYLATLDGEIVGENKPFTGMAEFEEGKWIDDEKDFQCILAWMPLPEPYKGD